MAPSGTIDRHGPLGHAGPLAVLAAWPLLLVADPVAAQQVRVCTDLGAFTIELAPEAPAHVTNFMRLVDSGFYNGTVFHRVVTDRIVQGGGYDRAFARRPAGDPVVNESQNGLRNARGTVAAARLRDPDTATSQFYINLTDNEDLNATSRRPGYTVFGRVTSGMDVVDAIGRLPTGAAGTLPQDVPDPVVVIGAITVIDAPAGSTTVPAAPESAANAATDPVPAEPEAAPDAAAAASDTVLARLDAQRAACEPIALAELLDEAEASLRAGLSRRARFALENFFVESEPDDPDIFRAQSLFRTLPRIEQEGIAPLIAHCPSVDLPTLPAGRTASLEEMQSAQGSIREFLYVSEAYLECVSDVIDAGSLDDAQEVAAVSEHDETVSLMEQVAEAYNNELRQFRARN